MARLETAIYTDIWCDILEKFDATSKYLQIHTTVIFSTAAKSLSLENILLNPKKILSKRMKIRE